MPALTNKPKPKLNNINEIPINKNHRSNITTQLEWALAGMARSRNPDKSEATFLDSNPEPRHEFVASKSKPRAGMPSLYARELECPRAGMPESWSKIGWPKAGMPSLNVRELE
jgi:hypothetical protein